MSERHRLPIKKHPLEEGLERETVSPPEGERDSDRVSLLVDTSRKSKEKRRKLTVRQRIGVALAVTGLGGVAGIIGGVAYWNNATGETEPNNSGDTNNSSTDMGVDPVDDAPDIEVPTTGYEIPPREKVILSPEDKAAWDANPMFSQELGAGQIANIRSLILEYHMNGSTGDDVNTSAYTTDRISKGELITVSKDLPADTTDIKMCVRSDFDIEGSNMEDIVTVCPSNIPATRLSNLDTGSSNNTLISLQYTTASSPEFSSDKYVSYTVATIFPTTPEGAIRAVNPNNPHGDNDLPF